MQRSRNWTSKLSTMALMLALSLGVTVAIADNDNGPSDPPAETVDRASDGASLDGAKVYAWNCGTCHSERWPKERSDAQWDVIVTHMRVRANMTADQTEAVLHYLKENN